MLFASYGYNPDVNRTLYLLPPKLSCLESSSKCSRKARLGGASGDIGYKVPRWCAECWEPIACMPADWLTGSCWKPVLSLDFENTEFLQERIRVIFSLELWGFLRKESINFLLVRSPWLLVVWDPNEERGSRVLTTEDVNFHLTIIFNMVPHSHFPAMLSVPKTHRIHPLQKENLQSPTENREE